MKTSEEIFVAQQKLCHQLHRTDITNRQRTLIATMLAFSMWVTEENTEHVDSILSGNYRLIDEHQADEASKKVWEDFNARN